MTIRLSDLVLEVKKLELEEVRTNTAKLFEFVIQTKLLPELSSVLENHFGPPLKPAGKNPSKEAAEETSAFGGVRKDQTLYFTKSPEGFYYALLWPWANGLLLTVKIVQEAKS